MTALTNWLTGLLGRIGIPKAVSAVIVHVLVVFITASAAGLAFPVIIRAVGAGPINWPALAALVTAAAGSGASAVGHYLVGLIPTPKVTPPVTPTK